MSLAILDVQFTNILHKKFWIMMNTRAWEEVSKESYLIAALENELSDRSLMRWALSWVEIFYEEKSYQFFILVYNTEAVVVSVGSFLGLFIGLSLNDVLSLIFDFISSIFQRYKKKN